MSSGKIFLPGQEVAPRQGADGPTPLVKAIHLSQRLVKRLDMIKVARAKFEQINGGGEDASGITDFMAELDKALDPDGLFHEKAVAEG